MSYLVLARKWRPKHFDEVVGQGHVARTLRNSIEQNRVHHAYLFCGTRGVGKTTMARIVARALNCHQGPTTTPCYECPSCEEISSGQSVDVFEIDGASNRGINEIRDLRDGVRYAPSRDRNKIYIIDEVHMLTTEAFNALLKTLEEPPPHARFIFATTEPQKIPVTILSRCQRFDFKRISQQDIVEHLERLCDAEGIEAERAALQLVARQAQGGMRDALSLLDQIISFAQGKITEHEVAEILGVANRKHLFELSEAVIARNSEQALTVLDEVHRYGYDLQQFASELVQHFRDLMVVSVVSAPERVTQLTESELKTAAEQVDGRPTELLHRYFSAMVKGAQEMHRSPYPKLLFEMTLVRLCELEPLMEIDLLVDRLSFLESALQGDELPGLELPPPGKAPAGTPEEPGPPEPAPPEPAPPEPAPPEPAQPEPPIREPLRPVDTDEVDRPDLRALTSPEDRWRALVDYLRLKSAPVAATCEHAQVDRFEDGEIFLSFEEGFLQLADDANRLDLLEEVLAELFGEHWTVTVTLRTDDATGTTLAQERQEDLRRRREALAAQLRDNPAVRSAQEIFGADEPRISVTLFDEQ